MNKTALLLLLIVFLCMLPVAGEEGPRISINASRQNVSYGDKLVFSGASNGFTMYFFMTGPGLDPAGVMTFNTTKSAKTKGHVTAVPQNGVWHFGWKTGNVSGRLQNGNYTIYACIGPFDTEQLKTCTRCNCVTTNVTLYGVPESRALGDPSTVSQEKTAAQENLTIASSTTVSPPSTTPAGGSPANSPTVPAPSSCLPAGIAAMVAGLTMVQRRKNVK